MATKGYCASLKRWFIGLREHLVFTPDGRIATMFQMKGNCHDIHGLYVLLEASFRGCLLADNGYWPGPDKREKLAQHGITVIASSRRNQKFRHTRKNAALLKKYRPYIERFIGLFNQQFHASRTRCRNFKNYMARRWFKVMAHNASRSINKENQWSKNSLAHIRRVS